MVVLRILYNLSTATDAKHRDVTLTLWDPKMVREHPIGLAPVD